MNWKCQRKGCSMYVKGVSNNCTEKVNPCYRAILEDKIKPTRFVDLEEASIEDLSIIILDRSFGYEFRKEALKEHDGRF